MNCGVNILGLCLLVGSAFGAEWSYEGATGVDFWDTRDGTSCDGSQQSPIDIPRTLTYQSYAAFTLTGYDSLSGHLELINNGHTAQINLNQSEWGSATLTGGGLTGTYYPIQLHFHWGPDDSEGSEHTFRGQKFPLEMHVVHYKSDYGSLTNALNETDGLAVLGFFFVTEDSAHNANLDPLINKLPEVKYKNSVTSVELNFDELMPSEQTHFYRYEGSLTTPECNEIVVWTVFDNVNTISAQQMAEFRNLRENVDGGTEVEMLLNYRPVQDLNSRTVYKNFEEDVPSSWHWGYEGHEGPTYWKNYHETCGGSQQSPVNIPKVSTYEPSVAVELATLTFWNYDQDITGTIKNNGHTIQVDITSPELYITNGSLPGKYIAAQFHFHWGADNSHGSEHTYTEDNVEIQYPLEMHIVHYKEEYGSLVDSLGHSDGLAVVGFFYQVSSTMNTNYADLITALPDVQLKSSSKAISGFNMRDLTHAGLKVSDTEGSHIPMYRYPGSLTTPGCAEIVTWTVMQTPIPMHTSQLAVFRDMTHITSGTPAAGDYITHNYRPVQPIGTRTIYSSFDYTTLSAAADVLPSLCATVILTILAILLQ